MREIKVIGKRQPSKKTMLWAESLSTKLSDAGYVIEALKYTNEGWALELGAIVLGEYKNRTDNQNPDSRGSAGGVH